MSQVDHGVTLPKRFLIHYGKSGGLSIVVRRTLGRRQCYGTPKMLSTL